MNNKEKQEHHEWVEQQSKRNAENKGLKFGEKPSQRTDEVKHGN